MVKFAGIIRLNSVELQLTGYSWSDPSRYAIEFVVFTANTYNDVYSEYVFEVREMKLLSCIQFLPLSKGSRYISTIIGFWFYS